MRGDMANNWKVFKQLWDAHVTLTSLNEKPAAYQVAKFIMCIGPEALEVHNTLPFTSDADRQDVAKILQQWDIHCKASTNIIFERYTFNQRMQEEGESFDHYLTALRQLATSCEYGTLQDQLIRDRIVCGLKEDSVRKRLLQEPKLDLEKCINVCKSAAITQQQLSQMHQPTVHAMASYPHQKMCKYCGGAHKFGKQFCPAAGKTCNKCGRSNHYAKMCHGSTQMPTTSKGHQPQQFKTFKGHHVSKTSKVQNPYQGGQSRGVHQVDEDTHTEEEVLALQDTTTKKVMARIKLEGRMVQVQVDSGATCNVLPKYLVPASCSLDNHRPAITAYGGMKLKVLGCVKVGIQNVANSKSYVEEFVVVEDSSAPLLGLPTSLRMELLSVRHENIAVLQADALTKETVQRDFGDVFTGLGDLGELTLEVDDSVEPQIMPPRRISLAVKDKLQEELQRLEALGIIRKVTEPTDWVSALVVTKKASGNIRVCLDPVHLNKALKRAHYPLPVLEDILPELSDAKVFTRADLKDGFLQVRLSEPSQLLTTFQTPWGRYCWQRLPFGVSPAPECFQQRLDQVLQGLPGVYRVADDLLIVGRGADRESAEKDHDHNMLTLLEKLRVCNIKLNSSKLDFKKDKIPFIGHVLSSEGLHTAPEKVQAIKNMPKPMDIPAVRRFLGMATYLGRFCSHLSEVTEPLRRLITQDEWTWSEDQENAYNEVKRLITEAPVLRFFDAKIPLEGQADASSQGLGFSLMQEGQPIAYASRVLTAAERNYAQIEKELLSMVFGVERHHDYTFGRHVILYTDHRPLVSITRKPLTSAPKRLQRLLLRLLCYDVDVRYQSGTTLYLADTLSRASLPSTKRTRTEEETEVLCAIDFAAISQPQLQEIADHTITDPVCQSLRVLIQDGWPELKSAIPDECRPFFNIRDELSVSDGIIWRGERCVIPGSLRSKIRGRLHSTHMGRNTLLRRAKDVVYWPGMNAELQEELSKCEICMSHQDKQQKEPLQQYPVPDRPWQMVATDIFHVKGRDYLCTVDYYSNFLEINKLTSKTASEVITVLRRHFGRYGIPEVVVSDNNPFGSAEFLDFARELHFSSVTSSPRFAQANGKAENAVKTAKRLLQRAHESGINANLALLEWRNMPLEGRNASPAQLMFGRQTRTLLPASPSQLKSSGPHPAEAQEALQRTKDKQAQNYNRSAKSLPELQVGDTVRVQTDRGPWEKGFVLDRAGTPRSYIIQLESGSQIRRNRRHLRKSLEPFRLRSGSSDDLDEPEQPQPEAAPNERPPQQPQPEAAADEQPPPNPDPPPDAAAPKTRSGRVTRRPGYLSDYQTE